MVVTVYYLAYGLGFYLNEKITSVYGPKKCLIIGSVANLLYVAAYLFPVGCKATHTGICSRGFCSTILFIFAVIGGCGSSIAWAAKSAYLQLCCENEDEKKPYEIFKAIYLFGGIIASLFALALLANETVRTGLYIVMTILVVNAALIQICKIFV